MTQLEFHDHILALNEFILRGQTVEAIEWFYAENVEMQENETPPRIGKAACLNQEKANLAGVSAMKAHLLNQAIDHEKQVVFSEWQFDFTDLKGQSFRLIEVSVQHWQGDLIQKEKFYYKEILKNE